VSFLSSSLETKRPNHGAYCDPARGQVVPNVICCVSQARYYYYRVFSDADVHFCGVEGKENAEGGVMFSPKVVKVDSDKLLVVMATGRGDLTGRRFSNSTALFL